MFHNSHQILNGNFKEFSGNLSLFQIPFKVTSIIETIRDFPNWFSMLFFPQPLSFGKNVKHWRKKNKHELNNISYVRKHHSAKPNVGRWQFFKTQCSTLKIFLRKSSVIYAGIYILVCVSINAPNYLTLTICCDVSTNFLSSSIIFLSVDAPNGPANELIMICPPVTSNALDYRAVRLSHRCFKSPVVGVWCAKCRSRRWCIKGLPMMLFIQHSKLS